MNSSDVDLETITQNFKDGEFETAELQCDQWLQSNPDDGKAWHLYGLVTAGRGDLEKAEEAFQRAIALCPTVALYRYNLGLAFQSRQHWEKASVAYRAALSLRKDFIEARNNLGNCLLQMDDPKGSADVFRELTEAHPDDSAMHFNLANVLEEIGEYEESLSVMRRAIDLDPDFSAARENLGRTLTGLQRFDEAEDVWREWLAHDPGNAVAKHMVASVSGDSASRPDRCDDEYVRETFDQNFASSYDQQLARIRYRVPELVLQAIEATGESEFGRVLDAGCGTGLCAALLRPISNTLVGVDLSGEMLALAKRRGQYDALHEQELTHFLGSVDESYDLIVSADTLCYFGKLREVFAAMCARLTELGYVVFSVERADDSDGEGESTFQLTESGRYRHHERYIRETASQSGLNCLAVRQDWLRTERGVEVAGLIVTLSKPR